MLLSGSVTLALWLSYGAVVWYPAVNAAESLPTQLIALLIFVGVVVFLAFGSGALVTGLLYARGTPRASIFGRTTRVSRNQQPEPSGV